MTTAEILSAAADLLDQPGAWTRHPVGQPGTRPIVRAIRTAAGPGVGITPACNAVRKVVQNAIACFEDTPGRTQAEVVAVLREAARLAQEGGAA